MMLEQLKKHHEYANPRAPAVYRAPKANSDVLDSCKILLVLTLSVIQGISKNAISSECIFQKKEANTISKTMDRNKSGSYFR